jgi:hypothetical protein
MISGIGNIGRSVGDQTRMIDELSTGNFTIKALRKTVLNRPPQTATLA